MKISAVLITFNEEDKIEAALQSLAGIAAEIIVVDSHSTDRTVKLARKYTDTRLRADLDELRRPEEFRRTATPSIPGSSRSTRTSGSRPSCATSSSLCDRRSPIAPAFSMPRQVFYLGRWIRHSGWYPDRKIRLFRKDRARWEGEYVHEKLVVDGEIGTLRGAHPSFHLPRHRRPPGPDQPVFRPRRAEALRREEKVPLASSRPPARARGS